MYKTAEMIYKDLSSLADPSYRDFQAKLMPTVDKNRILGVRMPALRKYAKDIIKDKEACHEFIRELPHKTYDEDNLHAIILQNIEDVDVCLSETERFLPYIDNWATCDSFIPKSFKKAPERILSRCREWLRSSHTYTVRYGIVTLMKFFLDEAFEPSILDDVSTIRSDEYYIRMAQAWLFSFAIIKQYDATLPYLTEKRLPLWVHNKTIQKGIESFQISKKTKEYLRTLRREKE